MITAPTIPELAAALLELPPEARRPAATRGAEWAGAQLAELRAARRRGVAVDAWARAVAAIDLVRMVGVPTEDGGPIYMLRSRYDESRTGDLYDIKPWVARITGVSTRYGLRRAFVEPQRDWSESKRACSGRIRGVIYVFVLRAGWVVETHTQGKKGMRRGYSRVTTGGLEPLTHEQVVAWAAEQPR